jgi:hypothetical protein
MTAKKPARKRWWWHGDRKCNPQMPPWTTYKCKWAKVQITRLAATKPKGKPK